MQTVAPEVASLETRPDSSLFTYYALRSLLLGPFFFLLLIPSYFRYKTLQYEFSDEGVTMRWGILFRKEIILTFARIQDIHLTSNIVERWLGLGRIQVQTASGNSGAEMIIEGFLEPERVRDFLYSRMRGNRGTASATHAVANGPLPLTEGSLDQLTDTLRQVADEVRALRIQLETDRATQPRNGNA